MAGRVRLALGSLAAVALVSGGFAVSLAFGGDPDVTCDQSRAEALQASRIVGNNQSYRRDNPNEYLLVRAYLDGGTRPASGVTTHMGLHLVYLEDVCRGLPVPPGTVTEPPVTTTAPPPPTDPPPTTTTPQTTRVYSWGFDAPHCTGDVWARSSWLTPACSDPDWYVEGIYYSVTSDRPTRVLSQDASGYNSTGTWQTWVHNPLTVDGSSWGTEHRVDISVKFVKWGSQAQSICSWAGGPKIFMGRPLDKYETHTYTVELQVCDGSVHIQKKEWGIFRCGQDPRAVDCGAGGTWYLLANARPGALSMGAWHTLTGIKRDNADGSVTLIGMRDGVEVIRYTEVPNDLPVGPLRGGRDGWRSNAIDWHMDSFTVTVK